MNTLTQPLRDEHKDLYPHVLRIREVADMVGEGKYHSFPCWTGRGV